MLGVVGLFVSYCPVGSSGHAWWLSLYRGHCSGREKGGLAELHWEATGWGGLGVPPQALEPPLKLHGWGVRVDGVILCLAQKFGEKERAHLCLGRREGSSTNTGLHQGLTCPGGLQRYRR